MNVGFCVSMTPRRLLCFAGKFNLPKIVSRMEALAALRGCGIERREEDIAVHFCPEGDLVFHPDEEAQMLKGSADSSIAGPGFHAAAADFCNALAGEARLAAVYEPGDPYCERGDFEALRRAVFLPFLEELLTTIEIEGGRRSEAICFAWPDDWYMLANAPENHWYCPTGLFPCSVKALFDREPMAFLQDFFIWPNREKDTVYLRNLAMSDAWTRCAFHAGDPLCKEICRSLEKVAKEDPLLPFPRKLYLELCGIVGRTPVVPEEIPEDTRFESVGFRKFPLLAPIGNWEILIPGGFRREEQVDGAIRLVEPDRCIAASSAVCQVSPDEEEEFRTRMLGRRMSQHPDKVFMENVLLGPDCRAELFRVNDWEHPFLLECRKIEPGGNLLSIMFNFKTRSEYEWGLDILKTAHCRDAVEEV